MSQHSSLKIDLTKVKHRNVLKRHERVHRLQEIDKWNDRQSAFGLPKVKSLKIKVKKIKEVKAEAALPAATTTAAQAAPSSPEKKKAQTPAEKKPAEKTEKSNSKK